MTDQQPEPPRDDHPRRADPTPLSCSMSTAAHTVRKTKPAWLVILLCWLIVVLDGYDLIVYGTTLPTIMKEWPDLDPAAAGFLGSLVFVGALFGALGAGDIADRLGRKKTILASGLLFTVFTIAIYFAPNREIFGLFRFIAGVGLGGLVPSANAITAEFVHVKSRSFVSTIMMSGIPIGGSIAALLGLVMLPNPGWRPMYALAAFGLVILAVAWFVMPESPSWLRAHGREAEARRIAAEWGVDHTLEDVIGAPTPPARPSPPPPARPRPRPPPSRSRRVRKASRPSSSPAGRSPRSCSRWRPSSPCSPGTAWAPGCRSSWAPTRTTRRSCSTP